MMMLMMSLALLAADPAPTALDRVFAASLERALPPAPSDDPLIAQLGDRNRRRRQAAQQELERRLLAGDARTFRELIRAERGHPDSEVRMRAESALLTVTRCRDDHTPGYDVWCSTCGGTGDVRYSGRDDDGQLILRDLTPRDARARPRFDECGEFSPKPL